MNETYLQEFKKEIVEIAKMKFWKDNVFGMITFCMIGIGLGVVLIAFAYATDEKLQFLFGGIFILLCFGFVTLPRIIKEE